MQNIARTPAWVPQEAIQTQIVAEYAIAYEQERLWIRGYLRDALAVLDRDNFKLVQIGHVSEITRGPR